jgi:hypothetical protein
MTARLPPPGYTAQYRVPGGSPGPRERDCPSRRRHFADRLTGQAGFAIVIGVTAEDRVGGELTQSMQAGVRAWVLRVAREQGKGVRGASPIVLLSLLSAAAFAPLVTAAAGLADPSAVAGIGMASSLGGGVLGELVAGALRRTSTEQADSAPTQEDLESDVARRIAEVLEAGEEEAAVLRAELAAILDHIDAGATALRAAVEVGNEQTRIDVLALIDQLGSGFSELHFLVMGVERAAANLQESLDRQDAKLRALIDQNSRQLTEARLTREAVQLIGQRQRRRTRMDWPDGLASLNDCPYRGLMPFDEGDAEVFYGRERMTAELVGQLAGTGLVVVTGASGAGKSSLIRAGLLPALARGLQLPRSDSWSRVLLTPGQDPLGELATHLAVLSRTDTGSLRDHLRADPRHAALACRHAALADPLRHSRAETASRDDHARLVLIVDQFEEIFALQEQNEGSDRAAFISALCAAATIPVGPHHEPPALVVIAVRGDYWDRCAAHPWLAHAMQQGQFVVGPMTESDLRLAITGPADAAGLSIDAALTGVIMSDLRVAGSEDPTGILPLLSQAMLVTWQNRDGNRLTIRGYRASGGVSHAVQASAEDAYMGLTPDQQELARDLIRRMIIVDTEHRLTRRPVSRTDLRAGLSLKGQSDADLILEHFASQRLVVLNGDIAAIAHDALLQAWPRLRSWLSEDQASLILYGQFAEDAQTWSANRKDSSFVYRGAQLTVLQQAATMWASDPARYPAPTAVESEFWPQACWPPARPGADAAS